MSKSVKKNDKNCTVEFPHCCGIKCEHQTDYPSIEITQVLIIAASVLHCMTSLVLHVYFKVGIIRNCQQKSMPTFFCIFDLD